MDLEVLSAKTWQKGPEWLQQPRCEWPIKEEVEDLVPVEEVRGAGASREKGKPAADQALLAAPATLTWPKTAGWQGGRPPLQATAAGGQGQEPSHDSLLLCRG